MKRSFPKKKKPGFAAPTLILVPDGKHTSRWDRQGGTASLAAPVPLEDAGYFHGGPAPGTTPPSLLLPLAPLLANLLSTSFRMSPSIHFPPTAHRVFPSMKRLLPFFPTPLRYLLLQEALTFQRIWIPRPGNFASLHHGSTSRRGALCLKSPPRLPCPLGDSFPLILELSP